MTDPRAEMMRVPDDLKVKTLQIILLRVEDELRQATGEPPRADDLIDLYAMAIGVLLDADTNLKTDEDLAHGAITAAQHISYRAKQFRMSHDAQGRGLYDALMDLCEGRSPETGEALPRQ